MYDVSKNKQLRGFYCILKQQRPRNKVKDFNLVSLLLLEQV